MSQQELRNKTKIGLVWNLTERFSSIGVQFLFGIILARLLSPEDYGVLAMPLVFLGIAQVFIDCGFSTALIRKPELTEEDTSTAFFFNVGVGACCYMTLFFTSPLIAFFFNTPILSNVLKFTALATFFNPLCMVQQVILSREVDFKTQTVISLTSTLVSGIIGLSMAYSGYGIWSLVFQQVGSCIIRTILFWIIVKWRPAIVWSSQSFYYLWGFGSKILVSGILNTIYLNINLIVIGKIYNANDLGNYTRAQQLANLPSSSITDSLFRVTLPVMSSIQNDKERLSDVFRKMIRLSAFCMFPIMLGLAAVADSFVRIVLTDKWEDCIILIQLLCFSLMWYPIHALNLTILTAKGRSDTTLKLEIIKKIINIIILCFTIPMGIVWIVAGGILSNVSGLVVNTYYTKKQLDIGLLRQMRDLLPIFFTTFIMWLSIILYNSVIANIYLRLFGGIFVGVVSYLFLARSFHKLELNLLFELLPIKAKKYTRWIIN